MHRESNLSTFLSLFSYQSQFEYIALKPIVVPWWWSIKCCSCLTTGWWTVNDFGRWWIRRWHITRDWYKMCLVSASNVFIWNFILRTKVSKLVELTFFQPSSAPSSELQKKLIQVQKAKHKRQNIIAIIEITKNIDNPIKMSSFSS